MTAMGQRTDDQGRAFKGSQLQIQLWATTRLDDLNRRIRAEIPDLGDAEIAWKSPRQEDRFREYWDAGFLRQLEIDEHIPALSRFWPDGGPHWDGLATVQLGAEPGVLLFEGKSYPKEAGSSPGATDPASQEKIERSLQAAHWMLGLGPLTGEWGDRQYQLTNRLAHLAFLRTRGVRAWLVHLLFTNDPSHELDDQTSDAEWRDAMPAAYQALGITAGRPPCVADVILPACGTYDDLVRATQDAPLA